MQQKKKINVKIDEKVGEGVYSNFCMITHSPSEFIIDFGRILPGLPNAKIYSRILSTPQHAKQFMNILTPVLGAGSTIAASFSGGPREDFNRGGDGGIPDPSGGGQGYPLRNYGQRGAGF